MLTVPGVRPLWSSGTRSDPQPKLVSDAHGLSFSADAPAGMASRAAPDDERAERRRVRPGPRYTRPPGCCAGLAHPPGRYLLDSARAPVTLPAMPAEDQPSGEVDVADGPGPPPHQARFHVLIGALLAVGVVAVVPPRRVPARRARRSQAAGRARAGRPGSRRRTAPTAPSRSPPTSAPSTAGRTAGSSWSSRAGRSRCPGSR